MSTLIDRYQQLEARLLELHGHPGEPGYELLHPNSGGKYPVRERHSKTLPAAEFDSILHQKTEVTLETRSFAPTDAETPKDQSYKLTVLIPGTPADPRFARKPGARIGDIEVGSLTWDAKGPLAGRIGSIVVAKAFQRKGVATAMWNAAHRLAKETGVAPPRHSTMQTPDGKKWAESLSIHQPLEFHGHSLAEEQEWDEEGPAITASLLEFHLPGLHDQRSHGHRFGGGTWGATHRGSRGITSAAASIMGIDGWNVYDSDTNDARYARSMLDHVAHGAPIKEQLWSGHVVSPEVVDHMKVGDTFDVPLMATGNKGIAETFSSLGRDDSHRIPLIYHFPAGTHGYGYNRNDLKTIDPEMFKDPEYQYQWDEAVVSGRFKITGMEVDPDTHRQIVHVEQVAVFDPRTNTWTEPSRLPDSELLQIHLKDMDTRSAIEKQKYKNMIEAGKYRARVSAERAAREAQYESVVKSYPTEQQARVRELAVDARRSNSTEPLADRIKERVKIDQEVEALLSEFPGNQQTILRDIANRFHYTERTQRLREFLPHVRSLGAVTADLLGSLSMLEFHGTPGEPGYELLHPNSPTLKKHLFGTASTNLLLKHPALTEIISRFKKEKVPLYVVGGPVRDLLSEGHPGLDLDMTTPADVPTIKRLVDDLGALAPAGEEFGTVKLIRTLADGKKWEVEITQHRGEVYDTGSRKPTVSATTDLAKDLGRRDFTLNSMALDTATGEIVDLHKGADDLQAGVLRTPLDPVRTFSDDPLRILRLVRFASTRGFTSDEATRDAARQVADRLSIVSPERRLVELQKILKSPRPTALTQALDMSRDLGLDKHLFGGIDLSAPRHVDLSHVPPSARLAALTFTTPDAGKRLSELKFTNEKIKHVNAVHGAAALIFTNPRLAVRKYDTPIIRDALSVMHTFASPIPHDFESTLLDAPKLRAPLPVTGRDAPANVKGKEIGAWLQKVEAAFLLNPNLTKEAAIALA